MNFTIPQALDMLARTPLTLHALLDNISPEWNTPNEGPDTWSVYDIIGHLIHGEKTDWVPRMQIILSDNENKNFEPFDRFAQEIESGDKTLKDLLEEFSDLREKNITILRDANITTTDLEKTGVHPAFGNVTLSQLLSTWVVHDLNHFAQIARVMAKQYKEATGPWPAYLKILQQ